METTDDSASNTGVVPQGRELGVVLVVAWCPSEPTRLGELLVLPNDGRAVVFGRGGAGNDDTSERAFLQRDHPDRMDNAEPVASRFVSRTQLVLRREGDAVHAQNHGKRGLEIDGWSTDAGSVRAGQTLLIKGQLLFRCTRRARLPSVPRALTRTHRFGEPDANGLVGESVAAWQLRHDIAFVGPREPHVLLLGESGTGKELVARALHALSFRRRNKLIARNAATFPSGLIDAELFGNVANYPNPGMPARTGVVGAADGSTLLLDEIGELPSELQAHLLRFLDAGGEYQRLGEAGPRSADVRVIAATNRAPGELKHDLAARLQLRVHVPSLNERIDDIPLLARHLLKRIAARDKAIGERFFAGWDGASGEPRITAALVRALLSHRYTTHVRELESLLWCALRSSPGDEVDATSDVLALLNLPDVASSPGRREATADEIRAALGKHSGVREKVWRELLLPNRYVLQRLMKRYGLDAED